MAKAEPMDAVALLKADHRKVEDLFEQFEKAKGASKKKQLAEQICMELTIHTKIDRVARYMVFYPVLYIILTLPLSAGRMWDTADPQKKLPQAYLVASITLVASGGWVDALLYTYTRRHLIHSGSTQENTNTYYGSKSRGFGLSLGPFKSQKSQGRTVLGKQTQGVATVVDNADRDKQAEGQSNPEQPPGKLPHVLLKRSPWLSCLSDQSCNPPQFSCHSRSNNQTHAPSRCHQCTGVYHILSVCQSCLG